MAGFYRIYSVGMKGNSAIDDGNPRRHEKTTVITVNNAGGNAENRPASLTIYVRFLRCLSHLCYRLSPVSTADRSIELHIVQRRGPYGLSEISLCG